MGVFLENLNNQSEYRWGSKLSYFKKSLRIIRISVVDGEEVDLVADRYRFRHTGRRQRVRSPRTALLMVPFLHETHLFIEALAGIWKN